MNQKIGRIGLAVACLLGLICAVANAKTERAFNGLIERIDSVHKTVTVVNRLTGFTVTIAIAPETRMTFKRQVEIDNLPEGQWVTAYSPVVDPKSKTVKGIDRFDVLSAPPSSTDASRLVQQYTLTGKIARRASDFSKYKGKDIWTFKHDARYELIVGNDAWRLEGEDEAQLSRRPNLFVTQPGTWADVMPEREIEVRYAEENGRCVMEQCEVADLFPGIYPYYINKTGGPSGLTLADLQKKVAAVEATYAKVQKDLQKLMLVKMKVNPELALAGEKVTLEIEAVADREPNSTLLAYPEYLKTGMKAERRLNLKWKTAGKRDGRTIYRARLELPADQKGQHLVRWNCDIGGDIKEFWRSYAVIDKTYAVCILNDLSCPKEPFHERHLPISTWELRPMELDGWKDQTNASEWAAASRAYRQYGDNPGLYPLYAPWNSYQMREDPPEMQRFVLATLRKMTAMLGFPGEADNFGEYTMGNETVKIARELGFKTVHSLCTEHHMDGAFGFNNFGKPERPYFISREDFRKTGDGGKNGMVGFAQLDRHIELARSASNAYNPEDACMQIMDRENVQLKQDPAVFMSRVLDHIEGNFQNRLSQRVPYFLSYDFQFADAEPALRAADIVMIDFLVSKVRTEPIAFCTYAGVSDYYRRHYTETPETTSYYHDYYAGMTFFEKPHFFPDTMAIENSKFMAIMVADAILPDSLYDYTTRWDYPDYGNMNIPRRRHVLGDFERGLHDKFAVTPKIVDTRGMTATRRDIPAGGTLKVHLTVTSDRDKDNLPLALWNIPREWESGEGWWKVEGRGRFVPLRAPYTGNLCGMLVANVKKGTNTITLVVETPPRQLESLDLALGPQAKAKFFTREGQTIAYVWPAYPWETELTLDLPAGKTARCYISPKSEKVECKAGQKTTLRIPAGESMRVIGLTPAELAQYCKTSGPVPVTGETLSK